MGLLDEKISVFLILQGSAWLPFKKVPISYMFFLPKGQR